MMIRLLWFSAILMLLGLFFFSFLSSRPLSSLFGGDSSWVGIYLASLWCSILSMLTSLSCLVLSCSVMPSAVMACRVFLYYDCSTTYTKYHITIGRVNSWFCFDFDFSFFFFFFYSSWLDYRNHHFFCRDWSFSVLLITTGSCFSVFVLCVRVCVLGWLLSSWVVVFFRFIWSRFICRVVSCCVVSCRDVSWAVVNCHGGLSLSWCVVIGRDFSWSCLVMFCLFGFSFQ